MKSCSGLYSPDSSASLRSLFLSLLMAMSVLPLLATAQSSDPAAPRVEAAVAKLLALMDSDYDAAMAELAAGQKKLVAALGPAAPPSLSQMTVAAAGDSPAARALAERQRMQHEEGKAQRALRGKLTNRVLTIAELDPPPPASVPRDFLVVSVADAANGGRARNGQITPQSRETITGFILPGGEIILTEHRLVL
jgi:hypothetical protein